ncbi:MAG: hypothetical protein AB7W16_02910 [Candidatus Obscuribacterales bacterium]
MRVLLDLFDHIYVLSYVLERGRVVESGDFHDGALASMWRHYQVSSGKGGDSSMPVDQSVI